jgi:hypothetical protein
MQAPTKLLADRYRFKQSLDLGAKTITWIAVDEQTRREVVASALPSARVAALLGVVGLRHPHLASICDVMSDPDPAVIPGGVRVRGAGIVVAELVRGQTLHLAVKQAPASREVTVHWWLGLCDAVRAMHQAGGAHGAISPRSIVVQPSDKRQPPVLTQLLAPSSGAYCAPERLQGRGPSAADDVWALHAALFSALTGSPPFKGDSKDQLVLSMASGNILQLADFGLNAPDLQALLDRGLTADLARRCSDVSELISRLEEVVALSERTVAVPGPALHVPDAREWEEDAATQVQDDAQQAASLIAATRQKMAPIQSLPPVPVEDEVPQDVGDEEDATTVMHQPPLEEIEAALRSAAARQPRPLAAEPEEDPYPSPVQLPPLPAFDDDTTINDMPQPIASEPPTAIMSRDELPFPPPPRPASFGDAAQQPGYHQPAAAPPRRQFVDSGYPPAISSFPPPIAPPMHAPAPDFAQAGLAQGDVAVRKASRGPLLVLFAILFLVAVGIGVAMFLNYRGAAVGRGANDPPTERTPTATAAEPQPDPTATIASAATDEPTPSAPADEQPGAVSPEPTTTSTASTTAKASPSLAAAVSAATGTGPQCVTAHFEAGSFKKDEEFGFLCKLGDLRNINAQLHRRLVVAGAGKVTPGMREWSLLGWYELAATAVIRANCCTALESAAVELPQTGGGCAQLSGVIGTITKRPFEAGQVEARAKSVEDAIRCLYDSGTPRPFSYKHRPSDQNRNAFEAFFRRASELERQR